MSGRLTAWTLRPAQPADEPFLRTLFATVRAEQYAALDLHPDALDDLLGMQYAAQDAGYRNQHPDATFHVVEVDGVPAGRLIVDRSGPALHVLDIALAPDQRGRGLGQALLRDLGREGRPITLSAVRGGRALNLYRRLGFVPVGGDDVYLALEWRPAVS